MSEAAAVDRTISIRAESLLADADTCKFTVNRTVHAGGPFLFENAREAAGSPLIERLFALPGVAHVLVAENVVSVGKEPDASWALLKPAIGGVIRTQLLTGMPALLEKPGCSESRVRTDAELHAAVQKLLDDEVNRSIAAHGGKISIAGVRDATLFVTMGGGCQGCAASQMTLRQGLEVMVRRVAPEIVRIVDVTDHAGGDRPFYR
ncbi:MAG: NifU family protein [Candidatus Baltobacteraceae bacterium]|jgi:Fe-S cluster biogenesis protein NfuA